MRHHTQSPSSSLPYCRPAPGGGLGSLTVIDNRTGKRYELPISEHGTIKGTDLKAITAGGDGVGLRTYDNGYVNTTACRSAVSYIDGDRGILRYRGIPIEQLAEHSSFLEVSYLVVYGHLPGADQLERWEEAVMRHSGETLLFWCNVFWEDLVEACVPLLGSWVFFSSFLHGILHNDS